MEFHICKCLKGQFEALEEYISDARDNEAPIALTLHALYFFLVTNLNRMDPSDEGIFFVIREHTGGIETVAELVCSPRISHYRWAGWKLFLESLTREGKVYKCLEACIDEKSGLTSLDIEHLFCSTEEEEVMNLK